MLWKEKLGNFEDQMWKLIPQFSFWNEICKVAKLATFKNWKLIPGFGMNLNFHSKTWNFEMKITRLQSRSLSKTENSFQVLECDACGNSGPSVVSNSSSSSPSDGSSSPKSSLSLWLGASGLYGHRSYLAFLLAQMVLNYDDHYTGCCDRENYEIMTLPIMLWALVIRNPNDDNDNDPNDDNHNWAPGAVAVLPPSPSSAPASGRFFTGILSSTKKLKPKHVTSYSGAPLVEKWFRWSLSKDR